MKNTIISLWRFVAFMVVMVATSRTCADVWTDPDTDISWTYKKCDDGVEILSAGGVASEVQIPLEIGETVVRKIAEGCFIGNNDIVSVYIPGCVTNIGAYAFCGCLNLRTVTIADGIYSIGSGAFANCTSLKSMELPSSLMKIGERIAEDRSRYGIYADNYEAYVDYTLRLAKDWEDIKHKEGVVCEELGADVVNVSLALPEGLCALDYGIVDFMGSMTVSTGIKRDASGYWTSFLMTNFTAAASYHNLGLGAFEGCSSLERVTFSNGISLIGAASFKGCIALRELTIPESVTSIGGYCEHVIKGVQSDATQTNYCTYINVEIGGFAEGCTNLASVVLPHSLKYLGPKSFAGCNALKNMELPDTLTYVSEGMFASCTNLEGVKLPASLELLGGHKPCLAFSYGGASSFAAYVTDKNAVKYDIASQAWISPNGHRKIIESYDEDCTYRKDVWTFSGSDEDESNATLTTTCQLASDADNRWLPDVDEVALPSTEITSMSNEGDYLGELLMFLMAKRVPSKIDEFEMRLRFHPSAPSGGVGVFDGCTSLKTIELPNAVRRIADYAFYGCSSLEEINVPESLELVGYKAFAGTSHLPEIGAPWEGYVDVIDSMIEEGRSWRDIATVFDNVVELISNIATLLTQSEIAYVVCAFESSIRYAVHKMADDASGIYGLQTFDGIGSLYTGLAELVTALGTELPIKIKEYVLQSAVEGVDYAVRKLADNACEMDSLQTFDGIGSLYTGLAELVTAQGTGLSNTFKQHVLQSAVEGVDSAARKFAGNASQIDDLQICEGIGSVYTGLAELVTAIGCDLSNDLRSKIATTVIMDANYVFYSVQTTHCIKEMLWGVESVLTALNWPMLSSAQKEKFEEALTDVMLRAILCGCADSDFIATVDECIYFLKGVAIDPVPVLSVNATEEEVSSLLESMADRQLCDIIDSPDEYDEFRSWAKSVNGGAAAVAASQHAAVSYMLGTGVLLAKEPTIELDDVEVGGSSDDKDEKGAITVSVIVKDGDNRVSVAKDKVANMFEATSSLEDWNGDARLDVNVEIVDTVDGSMRFKVKPGDGTAKSAFIRIRR